MCFGLRFFMFFIIIYQVVGSCFCFLFFCCFFSPFSPTSFCPSRSLLSLSLSPSYILSLLPLHLSFPRFLDIISYSPLPFSLSPPFYQRSFRFLLISLIFLPPPCHHSALLSFGCFVAEKSIKEAVAAGASGGVGVRIGTGGWEEVMNPRRHSIIPRTRVEATAILWLTRTPGRTTHASGGFTRDTARKKSLV